MTSDVPLDRLHGCLLGVAVGDALGLPMEGLAPKTIARRFGALDRYHLVGVTGFVSDDTEQTALLAEALAAGADDDAVVRKFRWSLRWWFARLPFGIGLATLRSCVKLWLGLSRSGVSSGGNGAAMRAGILGAAITDPARRRALGTRLAEVTHTHPLAVEGALYVAELAAACVASNGRSRRELIEQGRGVLTQPLLVEAVTKALAAPADPESAARELGSTGFVVHSVGLSTWAFLHGTSVHDSLVHVIRAGGDTDTHGAIVGGWTGALHGVGAIPEALASRLAGGPFGPKHLEGLARALAGKGAAPGWSAVLALFRNLALYPVVLAHGFRRLIPFG
jgi:ADP-ribosylglycohydrolase